MWRTGSSPDLLQLFSHAAAILYHQKAPEAFYASCPPPVPARAEFRRSDDVLQDFRGLAALEMRDANNKQIRRYTTWDIPEGLTPAKARKAAERAADAWERETREEYQKEKEQ